MRSQSNSMRKMRARSSQFQTAALKRRYALEWSESAAWPVVCQTREMVRRPRQTIQAATITWKVAYTGSLKQTEKGASKTTRGVVTLSMSGPPVLWAIPCGNGNRIHATGFGPLSYPLLYILHLIVHA